MACLRLSTMRLVSAGPEFGQQTRLYLLRRFGADLGGRDELVSVAGVGDRIAGHQQVVLAPAG